MIIGFIKKKKSAIVKTTLIILLLASIKVGFVEYLFRTAVMEIYDLIVNIEMLLNIKADKEKLLGADFRLFQDTPAWELAKAVKWQDTTEIRRQVQELKVPIDFQEEKYDRTLLMLSVLNSKEKSIKALLELGANPNLSEDSYQYNGDNSVIMACEYPYNSSKILNLLLLYGGNPNSISKGVYKSSSDGNISPYRETPLHLAAQSDIENLKLLINAGADVNLNTDFIDPGATSGAFQASRMDCLLYLLEHGADFNCMYRETIFIDSPKVDILYKLRQCILPLDSEQYEYKMKVVDFLQKRGLNYWDSEIPDYILKRIKDRYPDDWEEYIQKY